MERIGTKSRGWGWTLLVVLWIGLGESLAYGDAGSLALLVSLASLGDVGLRETRAVNSQAQYPYCGLYAMASFLELWGNRNSTGEERLPSIEPAFLALAYNRIVGAGSGGTRQLWLAYVVSEYGALPSGAHPVHEDRLLWPTPQWQDRHKGLISPELADDALEAGFVHPSVAHSFTGRNYLKDNIDVDFRSFAGFVSSHTEKYKPSPPSTDPPTEIRAKSKSELTASMNVRLKGAGFPWENKEEKPERMYRLIKAQLEKNRPVIVAINPGVVRGHFADYRVIGPNQLLPVGEAVEEAHAMVGVGYCDGKGNRSDACAPFVEPMKANHITECLIVQNSWGDRANAKGYVCLSHDVMERVLQTASISRDVL